MHFCVLWFFFELRKYRSLEIFLLEGLWEDYSEEEECDEETLDEGGIGEEVGESAGDDQSQSSLWWFQIHQEIHWFAVERNRNYKRDDQNSQVDFFVRFWFWSLFFGYCERLIWLDVIWTIKMSESLFAWRGDMVGVVGIMEIWFGRRGWIFEEFRLREIEIFGHFDKYWIGAKFPYWKMLWVVWYDGR